MQWALQELKKEVILGKKIKKSHFYCTFKNILGK